MIEDDLHWVMMYSRWLRPQGWPANKQAIFGGLPPVVRDGVAWFARRQIRKELWGQGLGRNTDDEIFHVGREELDALSDFLAGKRYFLGDEATTLDATAFGLLSNVIWPPVESPLKEHARQRANLVAFCERGRDRYFDAT